MGTHSTIHIYGKHRKNLVNIYTQYDGYYEGVGQEIYEWWSNKDNYGNGFEDTALLFVAYYKGDSAYNKYLTTENDVHEFNYYIYDDDDGIHFRITCEEWDDLHGRFIMETLRYSSLEEFKQFMKTKRLLAVLWNKHYDDFKDFTHEGRIRLDKKDYDELVSYIKMYGWNDLVEEFEKEYNENEGVSE